VSGWNLLLSTALPLLIHPKGVVSSMWYGMVWWFGAITFESCYNCFMPHVVIDANGFSSVHISQDIPPLLTQRGGLSLGQRGRS